MWNGLSSNPLKLVATHKPTELQQQFVTIKGNVHGWRHTANEIKASYYKHRKGSRKNSNKETCKTQAATRKGHGENNQPY